MGPPRRKIRLIEGNAESYNLKKFICLRPRTPYLLPPLQTVYVHTVYLFTQGKDDGGEVKRIEGQQTQSRVENTNMTDCISSL
jgi:hypothetical protein